MSRDRAAAIPPVSGGDAETACRVARAKAAVALAFVVAALVEVAGDIRGLQGGAWAVCRAVVGIVFIATLVLWIALAFRTAGGPRTWLGPVAIAVAVAVAFAALGSLLA